MIKFQYNKTALQSLKHQLGIREKALPILKNKETALRQEIKKVKTKVDFLERQQQLAQQEVTQSIALFTEFPNILHLKSVDFVAGNIAGVKLKTFAKANFEVDEISWMLAPGWLPRGIEKLKQLIEADIALINEKQTLETLHLARKKTTQKVNLYEKMQIPAYQEAIIKIKRFLEDRENTQKAAQKIVKSRRSQIDMQL